MKYTLKTIAVLAAITISSICGAAAEQVRVGFAAEPYPPFASPDASGNWEGWEVDFMKAMCSEAKLDCVISAIPYDGLIPALTASKIDIIIASVTITDKRKQTIDFSDYYYKTEAGLLTAKGSDLQVTPEGLAGKTIGVQSGSIHEAYATKHFVPAGAELKTYLTGDESFNDLASGRVDAVQADVIALDAYLKSDQGKDCCELRGKVQADASVLGNGIGVGLRKGDEDLKVKINAAIKAIRANGVYDKFSKKYFDFDVYGG
ncbi:transporter substrate-binding domain-containing protein [Rhizobium leguminosarum]|uniref:Amino acid ABC transporter n=1 Tax=Rhizobium leguminosarum TaxID=384 RepID=A0A1B1CKI8_RHILE|nr:transporter substrate-binding domain-containing protein [Rhizobium leguminosarum]ANP90268.1 amino acid ABC transporter [Rhizobium leguminosarum]